jgi:hypothetical protein
MASEERDSSGTPLRKKLGIRDGARVCVLEAPAGFDLRPLSSGVELLGRAGPRIDVALLFVTEDRVLRRRFPALVRGLRPDGRLWVAWPKKASGLGTDLDFAVVQRTGLDAGLVDNKSASITEAFQGLQFVYRLANRPR